MPARRKVIHLLACVAAVPAGLVAFGTRGDAETRPAPALPKQMLQHPKVSLATLAGKPALVNFWASWCPPCREEAPALRRFADQLGDRGHLVGIAWADNAGSAREFVRRYHWRFPILRDADNAVGDRYGITGLPTTFVLDARGRIRKRLIGPQTEASLNRALDAAQ
jgi:cytochrome c biogenesis protein CcmG/thiol:disulfide interchange protein DsbE